MTIMYDKNFVENLGNVAFTENGAASYATAGTELIDQFGHAGTALNRPIEIVWAEQKRLWMENPEMALRFPFYLRLVTRKVKVSENTKTDAVQKGAGLRDEAFKRLLWVAKNCPEVFEKNVWLLPVVGSWKDLWTLMIMAEENDVELSHVYLYSVMAAGLDDATQCDLIRKYMPAIRSTAKCKTARAKKLNAMAKEFADYLGLTARDYRKMKASGTAHDFQKLICGRSYADINWNEIPGKALTNLIGSKFLDNHGLVENYLKWVMSQPTVKFTGYVYELGKKLSSTLGYRNQASISNAATIYTINKQFDGLIEKAKADTGGLKGNILCALDTSGSMTSPIEGANGVTSYDVCVSLGIYFAELNEGYYHNKVAMFDDTSSICQLSGTFSEKWTAIKSAKTAWGSTNFQSLIDLLVSERLKHHDIPESEFPQTLLVVSDMQFNPTGSYSLYGLDRRTVVAQEQTNLEAAREKLRTVFSDEFVDNFKFVWWYCASRDGAGHDVPATMNDAGNYLFSGFDGSIITLLLGGEEQEKMDNKPLSMAEMVNKALSQEIFSFVR